MFIASFNDTFEPYPIKSRKKMATQPKVNTFKTTARVVGLIYLLGFVVGIAGNILIQSVLGVPNPLSSVSARGMIMAIGAMLWFLAAIGDTAHGVLMFPVLKQHSERLAIGYLAARITDAVFIAVMVLFVLVQIPLGSEYLKATTTNAPCFQALSFLFAQAKIFSYEIGMSALGLAGLMLCFTLYKAKLVPRWLAIWGVVGYAIIFVGMISGVMGSGLGDASSIVGGLWEVFMGVWLIVKGFNSSPVAKEYS
jgi:hypothetical protein